MAATASLDGSVFKPRIGAAIALTVGGGIVVAAGPGVAPAPQAARAEIDVLASLIRLALLTAWIHAEGAPLA